MVIKISKWGNSLGLRIPKSFAQEVEVEEGMEVELSIEDGALTIRPLHPRTYSLQNLLTGVTEDNLHAEVDSGEPVGGEIW